MQKSRKKHSKTQNRWFYNVNSAPEPRNDQKSPKNGSLNRDLLNFLYRYASRWILTSRRFRICIWKVGTTNFWPCFGRPKLGECDKMGSVSKIMSRWKKQIRPQFSEYWLQIESAWAHRLWAHADSFWKRYFENCGRICFFYRLILVVIFLENRVNFGRP